MNKVITYSCGCTTKVFDGGTLQRYCDQHNPYKNVAPRISYE